VVATDNDRRPLSSPGCHVTDDGDMATGSGVSKQSRGEGTHSGLHK
jgi:hypothetical protein